MSWIFVADDGEQVHHDVPPRVVQLEQQLAEQRALYDKAFSDSGGLLHRKELVRMLDERDAQLATLRERNIEYQRLYNEMAEELSFWYSG